MCWDNILVSGFYRYQSSLCYLSVSWSYVTLYIYRYTYSKAPGLLFSVWPCGRDGHFKKCLQARSFLFWKCVGGRLACIWNLDYHKKKIYLPNFKIQIWGGGEGRHLNILIQCEFVFFTSLKMGGGGDATCLV